jgi:electron transport complex protein RnfB
MSEIRTELESAKKKSQGKEASLPAWVIQRDALNAVLPQTQCQRCGYQDCQAYATAMVQEAAPCNQCPPGGQIGVQRLAKLLNRPEEPLNPEHGQEGTWSVAWIDENHCIGCTLCLKACPVDAIVGAAKYMHTVIAEECTGCDLCLPVCPVDCIQMQPSGRLGTGGAGWSQESADRAQRRYHQHQARSRSLSSLSSMDDETPLEKAVEQTALLEPSLALGDKQKSAQRQTRVAEILKRIAVDQSD